MKDKLASIASIDIIIVDFTALADTDAEIMEAVESIRIMDYKVRFIFVMPYKAEGDPFLKECFYAGIYDLIISDQYLEISEQLAVCVTEGMRYKDALKYRDAAINDQPKEAAISRKTMIGIAGAGIRSGATHNSIVLGNFLRANNQMTAVLEYAQRPALQSVCEATGASFYNEGYFSLKGVDYYPECDRERLTAVAGRLYDYIIMDFGNYADADQILKDSVWIIPGSVFSVESLDPETSIRGIGKKEEFTNKLDQLLREYGYDKGYAYSMDLAEMISKETLHMPPEPEVEVAEAESSTSLNSTATVQTTDREGNYRKGNYVSLHVPDYKTAVYEIKEVCGIKEISGQILAETQDHLILEGKDGKEISVAKKEIYDEMQTSIVEKAMSMDQNVRDQIDLIGNPKLSAPQMDQILNGINDGLQPLLVAQYANPKIPAWQMDIYRYGMLNGLGYDQIKVGCLQDWDSSRNNIDNMIKEQRGHIVSDLKANNYIPEKRLVHKIGRLNGLTGGKFNKVSDIVNSVKSGKISNRYGEASLLKEIGDDLQHQRKIMSPAAQQKIHAAAAVPTR